MPADGTNAAAKKTGFRHVSMAAPQNQRQRISLAMLLEEVGGSPMPDVGRRDFITLLGGGAVVRDAVFKRGRYG
jgi:hypothetical protein